MDSYAEQIVKKADSGFDSLKRAGVLVGCICAGLIFVTVGSMLGQAIIGGLLGVGILYGGIYLSSNFDVEYEYLIVNGGFDIDKILAKKRRKPFISVQVSSFENFGKYSSIMDTPDEVTVVSATGDAKLYDAYYADFNHESYGKCRLVFTPNNKILREIKPYLKGTMRQVLSDLPAHDE